MASNLAGLVSVAGIYACFMASDFVREKVFKTKYTDIVDGQEVQVQFKYPVFLVFCVCVGSALCGLLLLLVEHRFNFSKVFQVLYQVPKQGKERMFDKDPKFNSQLAVDILMIALTYGTAMSTANWALTQVSMPTQVLVKSAKMVPVMLLGVLIYRKPYPWYDYVGVATITGGLIVYNLWSEEANKSAAQTSLGVALCFMSLICDGMTGSRQDKVNKTYAVSSNEHMFFTNLFASIPALLATLLIEGTGAITFCTKFPQVVGFCGMYCLAMTCGQIFIFMCLTSFGALYLALVTTTRKFFTVVLSAVAFGHNIGLVQKLAVACIFGALILQVVCSAKDKAKKKHGHGHGHAPAVADPSLQKPLVQNDMEAQNGRH